MSADPILVLQLQRMGDLILTFPLFLSLQKQFPDHPVWVVAEPQFFTSLMPLSPNVVYFPPSACDNLCQKHFFLAINLSGRLEASLCLSKIKAEKKIGLSQSDLTSQVLGDWSLYRFALTQNNHHNTFHWSDLYKLDVFPGAKFTWHSPSMDSKSNRVALVIGASTTSKRPDISFWASLARKLARNGFMPVLVGGPAEEEMGEQVERLAKLPGANLCGKIKLDELAILLRKSTLCVTPDTGPMHLADWVGTKVLNLSMGPVHAAETGPLSPRQWILRAKISCVGCWQCNQTTYKCKEKFYASQVANIILALLNDPTTVNEACPRTLELLQSAHDEHGLYQLKNQTSDRSCRDELNSFWRSVFLVMAGLSPQSDLRKRYETLCETHPVVAQRLKSSLERLFEICALSFKDRTTLPEHVWRHSPLLTRFWAGHTHMFLQNHNWEKNAWHKAMERMDVLFSALAGT